jgi:hypothetical protein
MSDLSGSVGIGGSSDLTVGGGSDTTAGDSGGGGLKRECVFELIFAFSCFGTRSLSSHRCGSSCIGLEG